MEQFDVVSKNKWSIAFKSKDTGRIINLNKKWIKSRFDGNVERIVSMDNTNDGKLIFYVLNKMEEECKYCEYCGKEIEDTNDTGTLCHDCYMKEYYGVDD